VWPLPVEPTACTPAAGWEKGQVENQVGVVRERFFTPRLRAASYEELTPGCSTDALPTPKHTGMRAAYDEVMTTGIKRRHEPPRIVGGLLSAEIAEKQARSIKYQLTISADHRQAAAGQEHRRFAGPHMRFCIAVCELSHTREA
jgi:hypothetical protein